MCPMALDPATLRGGLRATTRPVVPYGLRASSMKKSLAGLPVQKSSRVPNTRVHISKASDIKAIMGLQDMGGGTADNACKMHGHAATLMLQYSASTANHSPSTATVQSDPKARLHAVDRGRCGRMTRSDIPTPLKTSFATSSR
jgi:hypothetical protein